MKSPVVVIDCAIETPALQCVNNLRLSHNYTFTYHWAPKYGIEDIKALENVSAYIILGSHSNVADRLPWQKELQDFIKQEILKGIPTLGICFGHQLISDAFGGEVSLLERDDRPLLGVREIEFVKKGFVENKKLNIFVTHNYEVSKRPSDFELLATSSDCPNDGLKHKDHPTFTFQGHPEACMDFLNRELPPLSEEDFLKGSSGGTDIITSFLKYISEVPGDLS